MSASREKQMRKDMPAAPGQAPQKKNVWKWIVGCLVVLVAAALIVASLLLNTNFFAKRNVAVTVGEHHITAAEYNYFYRATYAKIAGDYGQDSLSYLADYITEQASKQVRDTYAIYDAAVAAGETLSEEDQKKMDEDIELLRETATNLGAASLDDFLASSYGVGCNEENYREYLKVQTLASNYTQKEQDSFNAELTQEKYNEYYQRNMLNFDTVSFRWFLVPVAQDRDMAKTEELARTMETMIKDDIPGFTKMAHDLAEEEEAEYYADESATLVKDEKINYVDNDLRDWMADASRQEGDTIVVRSADEIGTYVACFLSRDDHDYPSVNVRHILVTAASDADEETKKAAKEKAQGYLDEYLKGDKTEDAFAEIAKAHSEDNASNGGLYENVVKGQMVSAFNDWCYDPARQPGDTGIVETEYGYHVMYFVGPGENARYKMVTDEMKSNHYTAWVMKLTEGYEIVTNDNGMNYTTRLQSNAQ